MQRDLAGLRLLVTGAAGGVGWYVAEEAALRGARVGLADRPEGALDERCRLLRGRNADVEALPGDVAAEADRRGWVGAMARRFGGLDALVNCADAGAGGRFAGSTENALRQVMEATFYAPAELIRAAIPELTRGRQPAVVNVVGACGRCGLPGWADYSTSASALCGLTEALRGEMARFDIDVLLVVGGGEPDRLPSEVVAAGVLAALQANRAETVLGRRARWLLRAHRLVPGLVDRAVRRRAAQAFATR